MDKLSEGDLRNALTSLSGWSIEKGKLHREYKFRDFTEAFGFMTMAALAAEKLDHHPEWFNVYSKVSVYLTTHVANGITLKDLELARVLDDIAKKLQ